MYLTNNEYMTAVMELANISGIRVTQSFLEGGATLIRFSQPWIIESIYTRHNIILKIKSSINCLNFEVTHTNQ